MTLSSARSSWRRGVAAVGLAAAAVVSPTAAQTAPAGISIKACQVGYLPGESKRAMLSAAPSGEVALRRAADGVVVARFTAGPAVLDADTGDSLAPLDFSAVREPGEYYLDAAGLGAGDRFRIGNDVFARPFRLAMRSYLGQRCGFAVNLAPDFPQFRYDACHLAPATFHKSSGKSGTVECTGGWHDAGDFGRYVVNSGITTGTLLWAYELNAGKLKSLSLDLPESGGAIPDVLAEIKWNVDWMLKMQDADGGVWHKATSEQFCGFVMPADDKLPVFVIGSGTAPFKTTQATADFAAVCAIAARVYRPFDAAYADRCLAAAERAYGWAEANPNASYRNNPPGVQTGGYGDDKAEDERLWAAAELFRTTGKAAYNEKFVSGYRAFAPTIQGDDAPSWPNVSAMAMFAYALSGRDEANAEAVATIRHDALAAADAIVARAGRNGYRVPLTSDQYIWGSNGLVANYAMVLRLAGRIEPKPEYADAAQDALHYLLGRNAFATSFVTHVGTRWAMHPHHRPSAADGVEQPWPGLLVGGPNSHQGRRAKVPGDAALPVARVWHDDQNDYVTNETAINWNAPLVFILAEALPTP